MQDLNFRGNNYRLLYRKALSCKALFLTPFQTPDSQREQYEKGFMVLSDIDDTDESFSALQVTISADEQEEVQCQYDTTRLKINSTRPDTAKQNSSLYSDYNYQTENISNTCE